MEPVIISLGRVSVAKNGITLALSFLLKFLTLLKQKLLPIVNSFCFWSFDQMSPVLFHIKLCITTGKSSSVSTQIIHSYTPHKTGSYFQQGPRSTAVLVLYCTAKICPATSSNSKFRMLFLLWKPMEVLWP